MVSSRVEVEMKTQFANKESLFSYPDKFGTKMIICTEGESNLLPYGLLTIGILFRALG